MEKTTLIDRESWGTVLEHLVRIEQVTRKARGAVIIGRQDKMGYAQPNLIDAALRGLHTRIAKVRQILDGPGYDRKPLDEVQL